MLMEMQTLHRDMVIAGFEEKYPDWDPYAAADAIQLWEIRIRDFKKWMERPPVAILNGPEFLTRFRSYEWDTEGRYVEHGSATIDFSRVWFALGFKYMKTRILLWQFVAGCFQAGFIPVKAPWEP